MQCPYCKELFSYQNMNVHCQRKHLVKIQEEKKQLESYNVEQQSYRPRRMVTSETNQKIADVAEMDHKSALEIGMYIVQGGQIYFFPKEMAITPKLSSSDP